jgi:ribosomal protein S15P/S13E
MFNHLTHINVTCSETACTEASLAHSPNPIMRLGMSLVTTTLFSLFIVGCASNLQGGVGPLASPKAAQIVDLVDELYRRTGVDQTPDGECSPTAMNPVRKLELTKDGVGDVSESRQWKSSNIPRSADHETRCLTKAHAALEKHLNQHPADAIGIRNSLQDRLITASDQSCSLFKKYLNTTQSSTNFLLGSTALIFGAAATSVTSTVAAKNYTTGALMAAGLSAEFNADMFSSQMIFAIVKAIDIERERALQKLQAERSAKRLEDYGISAAIGDALRYHDICSLPAGLASLDKSITVMSDPGLKHIASMFPSGKVVVQDGRLSAENLVTGRGGIYSSTTLAGLTLPTLADLRFADAQKTMELALAAALKRLKEKTPTEPDKKAAFEKQVNSLATPATEASCAWEIEKVVRKFKGEDSAKAPATCMPEIYLQQVCNVLDPTKCTSPSRGLSLAKSMGKSLYESHHEWLRETKLNPNANSINALRSVYEIAWASHQAYINNWLQPAVLAYLSELKSKENETMASGGFSTVP